MTNAGIDTPVDVTPYLGCLRRAGIKFVCRYVNPQWVSYGLSRQEALSITSAALSTVALYEWGTSNYTIDYFTYHQGQLDAERAHTKAMEIGIPGGKPIYFAVDMYVSQADLADIGAYFDGVGTTLKELAISTGRTYVAGAYGGYPTVAYLRETGRAHYLFQTYAWSGGKVLPNVNLLQHLVDTSVCGFPNDQDTSYGDGGGFLIE